MSRLPGKAEVYELEVVTVLDQITKNDSSWLVSADVDGTIDLQVMAAGKELDFISLVAADVIYDTPVVDGHWKTDNVGYTFKHDFDTGLYPLVGGRNYKLIYTIPLIGLGNKYVIINLHIREVDSQDTYED